MGHLIDEKKHIEVHENKKENKIKYNTYEKIKDIVLKNDNVIVEKRVRKNMIYKIIQKRK